MTHFFQKNLLLLLIFSGAAFALDLEVKASVSASQVFIGDVFSYEIEITAPESTEIRLPEFVGNLGNFEVKDLQNFREKKGIGQERFIQKAVLNTFVSGDFLIAPQTIEAKLGNDSLQIQTDPAAIRVMNRTTGEETDILDIESPVKDPRMPKWFWITLAVIGGILLILLGFFLHRKFKKFSAVYQLPPYEEAVAALQEMRGRGLLLSGNQAEYFFEMGFIIRRYLERRFQAEILDATLAELRPRMTHVPGLTQNYKESMILFAEETEPVKFAKVKLPQERIEFWNAWADRLLQDTRPAPEEKK